KRDSRPVSSSMLHYSFFIVRLGHSLSRVHIGANPVNDRLGAHARGEDLHHPGLLKRLDVILWNNTTTKDCDIFSATSFKGVDHRGEQRHVRSRKNAKPDRVNV